jgi:cytochrome c-type biogenesis protein CcmH/NrfG
MTATLVLSALLAATQAPVSEAAPPGAIEQREVAFEELTSGRSAQAIVALESSLREEPGDPATLINLGAAYAQQGNAAAAARSFRAAMSSDTRYRLELADGSWVDSRQAARRALESLDGSRSLAALSD